MNATLLASALLFALTSAAVAAPVATPKPSVVVPDIEPAAVALLDKSVAAYRALDSLSVSFTGSNRLEGKEQAERSIRGTLMVQGLDKARVEFTSGASPRVFVANKDLQNVQIEPTSYFETRTSDFNLARQTISMLNGPLGNLMTGSNSLAPERGFGWKSVALSPAYGLDGVALSQKFEPTIYRIYFDPKSHLVCRIETEMNVLEEIGGEFKKLETTLLLTPGTPPITPTTFVYTPPATAKLVADDNFPKYYDKRLIVGAQPFALAGKTFQGKAISLADYKGKVVLLDFWATWCDPCVAELPMVEANYNKYHAQGFEVISIAKNDEEATVRAFVTEHGIPWAQVNDGEQAANVKAYGARAIPLAILVGKDGKIAAINLRGEELEPAIIKALAQ